MTASNECAKLIARFEGFMARPYLCSGGVWTIGYGTTRYPNGVAVSQNDRAISVNEAEAYLLYDLRATSRSVAKLVKSKLNQNQFDALVSFAYNVGVGSLSRSTLLRLVNENPNNPKIRDEFMRWNKAGGKELQGLTNRRKAEADLYFKK